MALNISTSHLNNFLNEVLYPQQSFAEILQHVQQNSNGVELEIEHVGHVLAALNTLAHRRIFEFAHYAEIRLGEILVDQIGDPARSQKVGSVYLNSPEKGISGETREEAQERRKAFIAECLSAAFCAGASSEDFHTDGQTEHLSAGNSSIQSA